MIDEPSSLVEISTFSLTLEEEVWKGVKRRILQLMQAEGKEENEMADIVARLLQQRLAQVQSRRLLELESPPLGLGIDFCEGKSNAERSEWRWKNFTFERLLSGNFDTECYVPDDVDALSSFRKLAASILNESGQIDHQALAVRFDKQATELGM